MNPVVIGGIARDELTYHGSYPFSDWGSIWKRLYSKLPDDAAYGIYDQCVRPAGVLPVPPLQFFTGWGEQELQDHED